MPLLAFATTRFVLLPKMEHALAKSNGATATEAAADAAGAAPKEDGKDAAPGKTKVMVPMSKMLVNVAGTMGTRYLMTSVTLVGNTPDFKAKIEENKDQLMDLATSTLSTKTISDLEKPGARNVIRSELMTVLNNALGGSRGAGDLHHRAGHPISRSGHESRQRNIPIGRGPFHPRGRASPRGGWQRGPDDSRRGCAGSGGGPDKNGAESQDFRNPMLLSPGVLRKLRLHQEEFVNELASRLSMYLRLEISLKLAGLADHQLPEARAGLGQSHASDPVQTGAIARRFQFWKFRPAWACVMVDRLMGGPGQRARTRPVKSAKLKRPSWNRWCSSSWANGAATGRR